MNKSEITSLLKSEARSIGFDLVGVVRPALLAEEGERLREWLERDLHGEMKWLAHEPDTRADPASLLPGIRSVIALAINYYSPEEHDGSPDKGKISRYAWGDDYHLVLKEKLWKLSGWLNENVPGSESKVCVDTSPVMDKAWAVRAGLGWLGKHTNVINPEFGSWVFLGEILTTAELDFDDEIIEDHCGTCTECLDACPTDAIVEPYLVDSNRCISYATIELRSAEIPSRVKDGINGWLFGCDICQDVCPWNRFQKPTREDRFKPRPLNISPALDDIVSLTHAEYVERFRKSAVKRTKLTGLKRNAAALIEASNGTDTEQKDERHH